MIKGLHHSAYRCRNSEETRRFYEDFLGLPLSGALFTQSQLDDADEKEGQKANKSKTQWILQQKQSVVEDEHFLTRTIEGEWADT